MWCTSMTETKTKLILDIDAGSEADDIELERLASHLYGDILELEVDSIDFATTKAPENTKSVEPMVLGEMIIVLSSSQVLVQLIKLLRDVAQRYRGATVKVKINSDEITIVGNPSKKQKELIDMFMKKHA